MAPGASRNMSSHSDEKTRIARGGWASYRDRYAHSLFQTRPRRLMSGFEHAPLIFVAAALGSYPPTGELAAWTRWLYDTKVDANQAPSGEA